MAEERGRDRFPESAPNSASVTKARARIGWEVMQTLFESAATPHDQISFATARSFVRRTVAWAGADSPPRGLAWMLARAVKELGRKLIGSRPGRSRPPDDHGAYTLPDGTHLPW